ncbi:MAG: FCD domain-containing protein [Geminicoccaceae bacterium]
MARMAGNPVLERMLTDIDAEIRFVRRSSIDADRPKSLADHRAIAAAIREGKAWKAMLAMNDHIRRESSTIELLARDVLDSGGQPTGEMIETREAEPEPVA